MSEYVDPRLQFPPTTAVQAGGQRPHAHAHAPARARASAVQAHAHTHAHVHALSDPLPHPQPQPSSSSYPSLPAQGHTPYYLSNAPVAHNVPNVAPPAPPSNPSNLDPALELQHLPPPGRHALASPDDADTDIIDADEGELDHDLDGATPGAGSAMSAGIVKRPRACDSCRGLKVRCDQDRASQTCRRCAKAKRLCVTTPPTRKRTRKADSRVAELERKIDALTASLHARNDGEGNPHPALSPFPHGTVAATSPERSFRLGTASQGWPTSRYLDPPSSYTTAQGLQRELPEPKRSKVGDGTQTIPEDMDAIHRDLTEHPVEGIKIPSKRGMPADHSYINQLIDELVKPEIADRIFRRYVNEFFPRFPAVPIPPGMTSREFRKKKPLLFLSILASSSHGSEEQFVDQECQSNLNSLLKNQFADIIWRNGQKSLEIMEALHVGVLWYRPPLTYEQHNFYMMVSCAAVMALDLGLGRRIAPNTAKLGTDSFQPCQSDASGIEARRAFLVCYYLSMSITILLRRPILLRWTKYMEESVKILESSPEALPSDRSLCQHVKLAYIGESISVEFLMDDPAAELSISEPKVHFSLTMFENELNRLKEENARMLDVDPALTIAEHVTSLYMHEIVLHNNLGSADFHPPYMAQGFDPSAAKKEEVSPTHISALGECLTATHGILDTILDVPIGVLLTLPVIFCVRAVYALVCLMRLHTSITNNHEVGKIFKKEQLRLEEYTDRLVGMFKAIIARDAQSPHGKFYFVTERLQERFGQAKADQADATGNTQPSSNRPSSSTLPRTRPIVNNNQATVQDQTPLHLLSQVAMGSNPPPLAQQQQPMRVQPQPVAWYGNMGLPQQQQPQPDVLGMGQPNFDSNFDFPPFDLNMGSDAELAALFMPDSAGSVNWTFPGPQNPYNY